MYSKVEDKETSGIYHSKASSNRHGIKRVKLLNSTYTVSWVNTASQTLVSVSIQPILPSLPPQTLHTSFIKMLQVPRLLLSCSLELSTIWLVYCTPSMSTAKTT